MVVRLRRVPNEETLSSACLRKTLELDSSTARTGLVSKTELKMTRSKRLKGTSILPLPIDVSDWINSVAALNRAAPWEPEKAPPKPLFVSLGSQNIQDAVLQPLGRDGGRRGIALIAGPDDHEAWLALEASGGSPEYAPGFPRLELTFGSLDEAHPHVKAVLEDDDRGTRDAVPSVRTFDSDGEAEPGTLDDMIITESVAAALASVLDASSDDNELLDAWQANEPASRAARSGNDAIEVELSTRPLTSEAALTPGELLDALRDLGDDDGWLAESRTRYALEYRLDRRFARSPEASGLQGTWYWQTFAQFAASHIGQTIATLDADGLDEVVFDIVPRKVSADVDYSRPFIDCLSALYRWLGREYALPQATSCLALLDAPDAVQRLEGLMGDSANFDPAKAMVMQARAAGIDPSTPEGAMQMREMFSLPREPMPPHGAFDSAFLSDEASDRQPPLDPVVKRKRDAKRKSNRKAARKARKKNR